MILEILALGLLAAWPAGTALAGPVASAKTSSLRSPSAPVVQALGEQLSDYKRLSPGEAVKTLEFLAELPKLGDLQTDASPLAADAYLALASQLSRAKPLDRPRLVQTIRVYLGEENASLLALAALGLRKDPSGALLLERIQKRYESIFSGNPEDFGPALEKLFSGSAQKAPATLQAPSFLPPIQSALGGPTAQPMDKTPPPGSQSNPQREDVLSLLKADPRLAPLLDPRQTGILPDSEVFVGGHAFVIRHRSQPRSVYKVAQRKLAPGGTLVGYDMNRPLLDEAANLLALSALGKQGAIPRVKAMGVNANGAVWLELEALPGAENLYGGRFASRPLVEKLAVLINAARVYGDVHAAGWVHDDIKPDNILIDAQGRVMVIDFGLSMRRGSPAGGGTPGFAAEADQIRDQDSDIYSFGKSLRVLLLDTRRVSPAEARASGLQALIDSMTQEDRRRRRPASMAGVMRALDLLRSHFEKHPAAQGAPAPGGGTLPAATVVSLVPRETAKVSRAEPALPSHREALRLASLIGVFMPYLDRRVLQQALRTGLHAMAMAAPQNSADEAILSWEAWLWNGELLVSISQAGAQGVPSGLVAREWDAASDPSLPSGTAMGSAGVAYASATRVVTRLLPRLYPLGAAPPRSPTLAWFEQSRGDVLLQMRIPLLPAPNQLSPGGIEPP